MLYIVSFSSGLSSALAAYRVINRYGHDNTRLVFMDTQFEDDDNYRFMQDIAIRFHHPIKVITEGRTPYKVSQEEHVIPNSRVAPCTLRLKMNPFRAYLADLPKPITIHIGYDFSEMHRCDPTRKNYESLGYQVDFPLLWKPIEFLKYEILCREVWGIEPPRMYKLGYTHANCGGRCVKQGQGDWLRTLINFPDRYAEIEAWEEEMRKNPTNANYALLKDRRGGNLTPKTLKQLRQEYESRPIGIEGLLSLDEDSSCVICGIGG